MKTTHSLNSLLAIFAEFFYFALPTLLPIGEVCIDVSLFNNIVGEESLVEYSQGIFLLIMTVLFARLTQQFPKHRGGLVLISGFLLTMLIREFDSVFDDLRHGSWVYFALTVTFFSIFYALKHKNSIISGLQFFTNRKEYGVFLAGLLILTIFSRLLGKKSLWQFVLGDGYEQIIKHIVEESIELLGYSLMLFAMLKFYRWAIKQK